MTLVELLVAITLSAMLLAALTGVLSGVAKQTKLADRLEQPIWPSRVVNVIRRDLIAAEAIWNEANTIWIRTDSPAYQNDRAGVRTIGYRCIPVGELTALERLDDGHASLMALGPTRIVMERLDGYGQPQPLPPLPGPVPAQVRIWIWDRQQSDPMIRRDLVSR